MKSVPVFIMLSFLLSANSVLALPIPGVTFVPNKVSAGGNVAVIVDLPAAEPVSVSWVLTGFGRYGSLPYSGGKYICHFSSTDAQSTCGPTPFAEEITYDFQIDALGASGDNSSTIATLPAGGIEVVPILSDNPDGSVNMVVATQGILGASVSYEVYTTAFDTAKGTTSLAFNPANGNYFGNVTLPPGEYFFAFSATTSSDHGGSLIRHAVSGPSVGPGPGGTSLLAEDKGTIRLALNSGSIAPSITGTITNPGNDTVSNLTVSLPADVLSTISVTISNTSLPPQQTATYTIGIRDTTAGAEIITEADIKSGATVVGRIPIRVLLSIKGITAPVQGAGLAATPDLWKGDFLITDTGAIQNTFTVRNNGDLPADITLIGPLAAAITVPPASIPARGSAQVTATVSLKQAGTLAGALVLSSAQGSVSIPVALTLHRDLTADIDSLKDDFDSFEGSLSEQRAEQLGGAIVTVSSAISSAESAQLGGRYAEAASKLEAARAGFSLLEDLETVEPPPGPGLDMSLIIPIAGGFIALLLVFIIIKVLRGRKGRKAGLDDEFGEDEKEEETGEDEEEF
ncbi:MAG: hypothetical protein HY518_03010 [Candidatus Aenigmarchaeota archaeon]|nr:hypothetical protein [Candidatus Aenigmarchaeota archaeon]